uniref:Uncharacterized protein n=1 Tax=Anguilla anguilla TaxID=7936 RepID=A0A0E9QEM7_ANGAN
MLPQLPMVLFNFCLFSSGDLLSKWKCVKLYTEPN